MKMKILVLAIIPLLVVLILTLPWLLIYIGNLFVPTPLEPEIVYGEFPFRLEYEINGRREVIQDTLICEYKGVGTDEGRGKYRGWEQRLASGNDRITLLKVDDSLEIYYPPGSANYYMDDLGENETFTHIIPDAAFIVTDGNITRSGTVSADNLLEIYNIKLISWDYTGPISNSFSRTK
ncbi:hypothetical protein [Paenibacillus faecalis]|uniref:hypothetical protein n=1 Tax=Paenibacillus faecalis TaxID=2079532 RepID=UPI000D10136F|nr:hypothetical protein [Paenibacillus faecalis]